MRSPLFAGAVNLSILRQRQSRRHSNGPSRSRVFLLGNMRSLPPVARPICLHDVTRRYTKTFAELGGKVASAVDPMIEQNAGDRVRIVGMLQRGFYRLQAQVTQYLRWCDVVVALKGRLQRPDR